MKKITRLEDVYCIPKTEEELSQEHDIVWVNMIYAICSNHIELCTKQEVSQLEEIPVDRFLDLLNDRIVPWRLEQVGFRILSVPTRKPVYVCSIIQFNVFWDFNTESASVNTNPIFITTFSELLQQMKFLGWKNETECATQKQ